MNEENTQRIVKLETMNGEVMRRLEKIDEKIDTLAKEIAVSNATVERLIAQRDEQFRAEFITKNEAKNLESRLSSLEGNITWGVRIIVGAVIVAVLSFFGLQGGK